MVQFQFSPQFSAQTQFTKIVYVKKKKSLSALKDS